MELWLSSGVIFTLLAVTYILLRWGGTVCMGTNPTSTFTFIAILFTSGLDVGLIMFPLTEFADYADLVANPEYAFANPLAIEFGYWGFLIWCFYFLTCFYFCIIEPQVRFFEIPWVKWVNNIIIIGTCAFTGYLLLANLPWYLPGFGDGESVTPLFYTIVFLAICAAVYSSTELRYVQILSVSTTWLFISLIGFLWALLLFSDENPPVDVMNSARLIGNYFGNIHKFVLPLNDYHAFYLYWWFAWSIMIGQFTARFVGGLKTYQVFAAMLIFPSIPIALWFSVIYHYHLNGIATAGVINLTMVIVGVIFVINSLDSLVRLYTDNLQFTVARLGKFRYLCLNVGLLASLTLLFQFDFLEIEWVGAVVIGLYFACFGYQLKTRSGFFKTRSRSVMS
jgi:glycine betaine transporter